MGSRSAGRDRRPGSRTGQVNARRLRELLTFTEDHPEQVDLTTYGEAGRACGPVGDLAGHALLLSGWELTADNTFRKDGREISGWEAIEREACAALGVTEDETWGGSDIDPLFAVLSRDEALRRLRALTEQAEAAVANA